MSLDGVQNNINFAGARATRVQGYLASKMPQMDFSSDRSQKFLTYVSEKVSSPEQRLVLGATALVTQPVIDYYNHEVDEETRHISVARTIAKIIAGTVVGVAVRSGTIALAKRKGQMDPAKFIIENGKKYFLPQEGHFLAPKRVLESEYSNERQSQYASSMGTLLALFAMLFTNFAIDAPLTQKLTAYFTRNIKKSEEDKK